MSADYEVIDTETGEVWMAIPGWPYEASSHGRIRRATPGASTRSGRVLAMRSGSAQSPYPQVRLSRGSRVGARTFHVHLLVALAFHGPRPAGAHVNHIDGDKRNSRPENLEWVTPAENVAHARATGLCPEPRRGEDCANAKLTDEAVEIIRATPRKHGAVVGLARRFGVDRNTIYRVLRGRGWSHV